MVLYEKIQNMTRSLEVISTHCDNSNIYRSDSENTV